MTDGTLPVADEVTGLRRARAATPADAGAARARRTSTRARSSACTRSLTSRRTPCRIPIWLRTRNEKKGRDGCRVPLPWARDGDVVRLRLAARLAAAAGRLLARPRWPPRRVVRSSTLELYREALQLRRQLQTDEELEWVSTEHPDVLHFVRPGGWHCVSNFGTVPVPLPDGVVRVSSTRARARRPPGRVHRLAHGVGERLSTRACLATATPPLSSRRSPGGRG